MAMTKAKRKPAPRKARKPVSKAAFRASGMGVAVGQLRYVLQAGNPGSWASNHREESLHFTGWNYVAIRAIGLQAMQATVNCYAPDATPTARMKPSGASTNTGDPLPSDHELCRILKRPSPRQAGALFRYEQVVQLQLTGTCLVWNVPNRLGKTVERYVIPTEWAMPYRPTPEMPRGSWKIYPRSGRYYGAYYGGTDGMDDYTGLAGIVSAIGNIIPAEQMQVVRWPHRASRTNDGRRSNVRRRPSRLMATSRLTRSAGLPRRNSTNPSLIITVPEDWDGDQEDLDRATKRFNDQYAGPGQPRQGDVCHRKQGRHGQRDAPKEIRYQKAFLAAT